MGASISPLDEIVPRSWQMSHSKTSLCLDTSIPRDIVKEGLLGNGLKRARRGVRCYCWDNGLQTGLERCRHINDDIGFAKGGGDDKDVYKVSDMQAGAPCHPIFLLRPSGLMTLVGWLVGISPKYNNIHLSAKDRVAVVCGNQLQRFIDVALV